MLLPMTRILLFHLQVRLLKLRAIRWVSSVLSACFLGSALWRKQSKVIIPPWSLQSSLYNDGLALSIAQSQKDSKLSFLIRTLRMCPLIGPYQDIGKPFNMIIVARPEVIHTGYSSQDFDNLYFSTFNFWLRDDASWLLISVRLANPYQRGWANE